MFDEYIIVDWSANSTPKRGADSIWYCHLGRSKRGLRRMALVNPSTRYQALDSLLGILRRSVASVLVGFDFPNAYPRGFAAAAGWRGKPWRAVWEGLCTMIEDEPTNANNRFAVASELNRRISGSTFPFWGCPKSRATAYLSPRKTLPYRDPDRAFPELDGAPGDTLAERRLCERYLRRTQPCWKLAYTGSVGSQALMGIPVKQVLRHDPGLVGDTRVWPFETGLAAPRNCRVVLAEVYPSILPVAAGPGVVKDALQVETVARCFAQRDALGLLASDFAGPDSLNGEERKLVVHEEGWILGAGTLQ